MTPLAHYLAKQLLLPKEKRGYFWQEPKNLAGLRNALDDTHFFEFTKGIPLIVELGMKTRAMTEPELDNLYGTYAFLPAPKTWIEYKAPWVGGDSRCGLLLQEERDGKKATIDVFWESCAGRVGKISLVNADAEWGGTPFNVPEATLKKMGDETAHVMVCSAHIMLVLINTPRIFGRRQHMPHAGLQRKLLKGFAGSMFPLHGWTEILLQVARQPRIDGKEHEAHLTGRKALHFCRKHIRIKNNRIEYVTAHWRGDPSLGIKRSRYKIVP